MTNWWYEATVPCRVCKEPFTIMSEDHPVLTPEQWKQELSDAGQPLCADCEAYEHACDKQD